MILEVTLAFGAIPGGAPEDETRKIAGLQGKCGAEAYQEGMAQRKIIGDAVEKRAGRTDRARRQCSEDVERGEEKTQPRSGEHDN